MARALSAIIFTASFDEIELTAPIDSSATT